MSIRAMSAVMDYSTTEGSTFLVLLMLADHANADGLCWPSQERVARRARVSRSTVKRAIEELVEAGELKRRRGGQGAGSTNVYQVMPEHAVDNSDLPVDKGSRVTPLRGSSGAIRGSFGANKGFTGEPLTVKNRKEPRPEFVSAIPEDFDPAIADRVSEVRDALGGHRGGQPLLSHNGKRSPVPDLDDGWVP